MLQQIFVTSFKIRPSFASRDVALIFTYSGQYNNNFSDVNLMPRLVKKMSPNRVNCM